MPHEVLDPSFEALIDPNVPVMQAGTGFTFTEGPIWHPRDQYLLFSDMPADVRRRHDRGGIREVMRPTNKGNGMTYDGELNLLVCEHSTSCVARFAPDGTRTVLASHFEGRELNSPNDIVVRSNGDIYFTDPWYGRMPVFGVERPRALGFQAVYRIPANAGPGDEPQLVVDRYLFNMPNGLCFCPDESRLYVNDTEQANIRVFNIQPDGTLANGRVFASGIKDPVKAGLPDGMKLDQQGNIWVTAPGGVWVYNPKGDLIGKLVIPEMVANLHWGGPDWRTLYMTSTTSLYTVETKIGPRNELFMRAGAGAAGGAIPAGSSSSAAATPSPATPQPGASSPAQSEPSSGSGNLGNGGGFRLDPDRCVMIIQDMQNDVVMEGGAFAESGSPIHCREQNAIPNSVRLADRCRQLGVPVIHVWFKVEPGAPGVTINAPLFEGLLEANALVRGTWGSAPVPGLEAKPGDFIVEKDRMSAWEGTRLETILKATGRDTIIEAGAWTNMSIEHTARTAADKGYLMVIPEDCCSTMNADWHNASINYAMQNVAAVTSCDEVLAALG
jgi:gluconolactonase